MSQRAQNIMPAVGQMFDRRRRVYTPGKYFVVFGMFPLITIVVLTHTYITKANRYQPVVTLEHRDNAKGEQQAYYPMPELLIDLSPDQRGRVAFLKVSPAIAVISEDRDKTLKALDQARPLITERLTLFLRALRPDDFRDTEQLNRIKYEMTRRVNLALGSEIALDVVLQQLVIQ